MRGSRRGRIIALTIAAAFVGAAPAVLAAIPRLDIHLGVAEACVVGPWPEGTSVTFRLKTAQGVLKDQDVAFAGEDGVATGCFDVAVVAGDRIQVKQGTSSRTLIAPRLKVNAVDRVGDQVRGKGPAARTVRLRVDRCPLGVGFSREGCADVLSTTRTTSGDGSYTFDTTGSLNLRGRDLVEVILRNDNGDRFRRGRTVPVYFVNLFKPFISGVFPPGPTIEFQLLDAPGGSVIGEAALPSPGRFDTFSDGASDVPVERGNQIAGDFAIDAKMLVPAMITSINQADDVVGATCFANRRYHLSIQGTGGGQTSGVAGPGGAIEHDVGDDEPPLDIGAASSVILECLAPTGDSIEHRVDPD